MNESAPKPVEMLTADPPTFTGTPCPICGWGTCAGSCAPAWRAKAKYPEDAAAEQSRNESLRVQRLVERVKELEAALKPFAAMPNPGAFEYVPVIVDAADIKRAEQALKGGAR